MAFDFPVGVLTEIEEADGPFDGSEWLDACRVLVARGLATETAPGLFEITEAGREAGAAYDRAVEESERKADAWMWSHFTTEADRRRELEDYPRPGDPRRW